MGRARRHSSHPPLSASAPGAGWPVPGAPLPFPLSQALLRMPGGTDDPPAASRVTLSLAGFAGRQRLCRSIAARPGGRHSLHLDQDLLDWLIAENLAGVLRGGTPAHLAGFSDDGLGFAVGSRQGRVHIG